MQSINPRYGSSNLARADWRQVHRKPQGSTSVATKARFDTGKWPSNMRLTWARLSGEGGFHNLRPRRCGLSAKGLRAVYARVNAGPKSDTSAG